MSRRFQFKPSVDVMESRVSLSDIPLNGIGQDGAIPALPVRVTPAPIPAPAPTTAPVVYTTPPAPNPGTAPYLLPNGQPIPGADVPPPYMGGIEILPMVPPDANFTPDAPIPMLAPYTGANGVAFDLIPKYYPRPAIGY